MLERAHCFRIGALASIGFLAVALAPALDDEGEHFPLTSAEGLEAHNVLLEAAEHGGKPCVRMIETAEGGDCLAVLPTGDFVDGTIELEVAGDRRADAAPDMRGFVGLAFRIQGDESVRYELLYLRPTNGRAEDQLRRNHSTQYAAHPEWPWHRLRAESPGVYESYADLVPGAWTRMRIEVKGPRARLFLHGAEQPALIVNDLKHGEGAGAVALWIGTGTEAWFRDLRVSAD